MAAANRRASADASALVTRLIAENNFIVGDDARLLKEACMKVSTIGVHFGARKAALVNIAALLPGFTGHETATSKGQLAAAIVNFIELQAGEIPDQQPGAGRPAQQPVELPQEPPLVVGTPEWTAGLIQQIKAALTPEPAVVRNREPAQWSDTDSEGPGFHSLLVAWYDDVFDGEEEDLLPLLQDEEKRISTETFGRDFVADAAAVAECRRQLPKISLREGVAPQGWSARKLLKVWLRAVRAKIVDLRTVVSKRVRTAAARQRTTTPTTPPAMTDATVSELPESRIPKKIYGETQQGRFENFLE